MTDRTRPERPSWLRRLFAADALVVALVFVACAFALPRMLSLLTLEHFEPGEPANLYVAVRRADDGFDLVGVKTPATLPAPAFVADGSKPSAPGSTEATDRVRVLDSDDPGILMETVWSNDDEVITSRYRVAGRHVWSVSRRTFGVPQAVLGLAIAVILAGVAKLVLVWRRASRAARLAAGCRTRV